MKKRRSSPKATTPRSRGANLSRRAPREVNSVRGGSPERKVKPRGKGFWKKYGEKLFRLGVRLAEKHL